MKDTINFRQQRTADGLKLRNVARALEELSFVSVKRGYEEAYIAYRDAYPVSCTLSTRTSVMSAVVPWVQEISNFKNPERIYRALQSGSWN